MLFEVVKSDTRKQVSSPSEESGEPLKTSENGVGSCRLVKYQFPAGFLDLKTIGATIEFSVGPKPVQKFRMIERLEICSLRL